MVLGYISLFIMKELFREEDMPLFYLQLILSIIVSCCFFKAAFTEPGVLLRNLDYEKLKQE